MIGAALKGFAAGAAGTTALNTATYLDMAVRARATSTLPEQTVEELGGRAGLRVPGSGTNRDNRVQALGALSGIAAGCGVWTLTSPLQPVLRRLPTLVSGALHGAGAMAATGLPMARLGLTTLASWSTKDWLADACPTWSTA